MCDITIKLIAPSRHGPDMDTVEVIVLDRMVPWDPLVAAVLPSEYQVDVTVKWEIYKTWVLTKNKCNMIIQSLGVSIASCHWLSPLNPDISRIMHFLAIVIWHHTFWRLMYSGISHFLSGALWHHTLRRLKDSSWTGADLVSHFTWKQIHKTSYLTKLGWLVTL